MFSYINEFKENAEYKPLASNDAPSASIAIKKIDTVFVPLKETDKHEESWHISSIEGMEDIQFQNFTHIRQREGTVPHHSAIQTIVLNDNIMTRLFVGGISAIGIFAVYNLLYKRA
jgi:hypothetical protein